MNFNLDDLKIFLSEEEYKNLSREIVREWRWKFAGMAMQGMISSSTRLLLKNSNEDVTAKACVEYADALIAELLKKKDEAK